MDQWIAKAEAALRTGQPRMAELYMRRGLSESPGGRFWLSGYDLWMAAGEFRAKLRLIYGPPMDQVSYALAGPSKGSR